MPGSPYANHDAEVIVRVPILRDQDSLAGNDIALLEKQGPFNTHFVQDRAKVYHILGKTFGKSLAWVCAREFRKTHDGHGAFFLLKNVCLVRDHVNRIDTGIEQKLQTLTYHNSEESMVPIFYGPQGAPYQGQSSVGYGCPGLSKSRIVHHMLNGILTKNLDVCKANILSTNNLKTDFDLALTHIQDFINVTPSLRGLEPGRGISELGTSCPGGAVGAG